MANLPPRSSKSIDGFVLCEACQHQWSHFNAQAETWGQRETAWTDFVNRFACEKCLKSNVVDARNKFGNTPS